MKILSRNLKQGEIKVLTENQDDLWYLSTIIEPKDLIRGKTLRKIKIGDSEQRKSQAVKKPVFLAIRVEKTEYSPQMLRVSGTVEQGPEDVPRGSYHTFSIELNSSVEIAKEKWFSYQLDRLKEAAVTGMPNILICILDREEALFALSKRKGYEFLGSIKGDVAKKEERVAAKGGFFAEVIKQLQEYSTRYNIEYVVVASPAFWKEDLVRQIKDNELKSKITQATCSSVDKGAINEVLKRPEVANVLKQDRTAKEIKLVDSVLEEISKNGAASYGFKEVEMTADAGAVKTLIVSDSFIVKLREEGRYEKLERIMKTAEKSKAEIYIINSEHDGGKRLDGLGGIAALLRYKLSYQ